MRASEIFGKEIKVYLKFIDLTKIDDDELGRMIARFQKEAETLQQNSKQDFLTVMYGDDDDEEDRDIQNEKLRSEIGKTNAQTDFIRRSSPK